MLKNTTSKQDSTSAPSATDGATPDSAAPAAAVDAQEAGSGASANADQQKQGASAGKKHSRRRSGRGGRSKRHAGPWSPDQFQVPVEEGKVRFLDFDLPDAVLHGVSDLDFLYCSPIQAYTLAHTLDGRDLIGKAQTGTGKTAAFLVSIITDLVDYPLEGRRSKGTPRALIVAPTRELALQIAQDAEALGKYADLKIQTVVGGMDYEKQRRRLQEDIVDILIATPGRLLDFKQKGDVRLQEVETLVLDEADRMLSMGFIPDVRAIIRSIPHKRDRQTLLFSATFSRDILNLAAQWTNDAVQVEVEPDQVATDTVEQIIYLVSAKEKYALLYNTVVQQELERVMVFVNRRDGTRRLAERLQRDGVKAALISGEIPQQKRLRTLEAFRSGQVKVLVATDVAGRGIHVDGVSHVINYNLPEDTEDYVHRIGRTGRAGATGTSISFACESDAFQLPELEGMLGEKLRCIHPPEELLRSVKPAPKSAKGTEQKPEQAAAQDSQAEQDSAAGSAQDTDKV